MKLGTKITRLLLKKLKKNIEHTVIDDLGFRSIEDFKKFINLNKNNREFYRSKTKKRRSKKMLT